jgi:precorrin-2 dehydrogenase/sirohydrochlorin ferrochelatase
MARKFPQVQPGGSLILAWQIKGKKVLVVGGGEVRQTTFSPALYAQPQHLSSN